VFDARDGAGEFGAACMAEDPFEAFRQVQGITN